MAILYDFLEVVGGAESLTINLANNTQQSIIVAGINKAIIDKLPKVENSYSSISVLSSLPIWKSIKAMQAFKNINENLLKDDVNLFSGSNAPLAVYKSLAKKNYYYCHTPPRFAYDLYDYYQAELPWYQRAVVDFFARYVRYQYEPALKEMDKIFCNSKNVQARIKKYLNLDAEVIYPPIAIDKFYNKSSKGYYLSSARLEDYKRVELIIDAFLEMPDKNLIVLSGGSLLNKLIKKSENAKNIKIVGWVSDGELLNYIAECIATIYIPIDEDFGMSPVESMAAGKPVIGVNEGGVAETVIHKKTGWLCPEFPCTKDIKSGVEFLSETVAQELKIACEIRAQDFSPDIFYSKMKMLFKNS